MIDRTILQNQSLETLLEHAPAMVYVKDLQQRYVFVNTLFEQLMGRLRQDVLGRTDGEAFGYPASLARVAFEHKVWTSLASLTAEETVVVEGGAEHTLVTAKFPLFAADGGVAGLCSIGTQTIEMVRMKEEAHNARLFLASVIEHIPNMIFIKDAATLRFVHLNKAGETLLGTPRSELIGKSDHDLFPAEQADFFVRKDREVLASGETLDIVEEPVLTTSGEQRLLHTKKIPLFGRDGAPGFLVGISEDITEQRRLEKERLTLLLKEQEARHEAQQAHLLKAQEQAARLEAERVNRVKDEFLATLSHELRTPLNAILGWSQLLLADDLEPEKALQALQIIERNARAEAQLVEDLLDVSNIIRGNLRLDVQMVSLHTVVEAACDAVRLAAQARGVRLTTRLAPVPSPVRGDARRLQQLVWNLVSNAIKFTPQGGEVVVTLAVVGDCLELAVADTGTGIKAAFLPYVFDRFRQADGSFTRSFGGLGLGLALVRELSELHGGSVQATSPGEGLGATFTVLLPVAAPPDASHAAERAGVRNGTGLTRARLADVRVLIVDDDADARELIATVLRLYQAEVHAAKSAPEALQMLAEWRPDVLVSDISMPGMDGYELIQHVRARSPEQGGRVAALALTAYAGEADRHQAIMEGYQMHMAKPLEPEVLVSTVAILADRAHLI